MLEVLPKAVFNKSEVEAEFYRTFFAAVTTCAKDHSAIVAEALVEAERWGLSAIDALHTAAAKIMGVAEFVTTEKPTRPLYRVPYLKVVQLTA